MSLNVWQCRACAHRTYPARLWCPSCGQDQAQAERVVVDYGELIAWTVMPVRAEPAARTGDAARGGDSARRGDAARASDASQAIDAAQASDSSEEEAPAPAIIATARALPSGPVLVLRLDELPTRAGQRLRLYERTTQGRALPWAWTLPD